MKPRLARGLQDILPAQMLARQRMIDVIRSVYERYGFVPLDTPAIEFLDVLSGTGGEEAQASIFQVANPDNQEVPLGLRFDLTVPLARVIAQYADLPRPFRRYQVAPVWRADKPGPGRFRQFTQFDLDSVGVKSEVADTEIIAAACDTLEALDVGGFRVRVSSRKVLNLLMPFADIPTEAAADVFRVLDKLDKLGLDKVKLELTTGYKDKSGDTIRGLGLSSAQVQKIEQFLDIKADKREDVLVQIKEAFAGLDDADSAIGELEKISKHLAALGYDDDRVALDLSIARGLAYYTGPVFEAVLLDAPEYGSVFGGGRYDNLVMRFLGEAAPATGASIGVDRLLAALVHLKRIKLVNSTAQVLITRFDNDLIDDYLAMAFELRRAGVRTEMYVGTAKRVGKQLKYADQTDIPIAIMMGSDEKEKGTITIKDLAQGREMSKDMSGHEQWKTERPGQFEAPRSELVQTIKNLLTQIEG